MNGDASIFPCSARQSVGQRWLSVADPSADRTVIVIDASDSAIPAEPQIQKLVAGLVAVSHAQFDQRLFFLGSGSSYRLQDFSRKGREWFHENEGRLSIIGPLFEAIGFQGKERCLVFSAGRIFDWEDWEDQPIVRQSVVVNLRTDSQSVTGTTAAELPPDISQIQQRIAQQITRVEVRGDSILPFFWDNSAYRWENGRLLADIATDFGVRIGLLAKPRAEIDSTAFDANSNKAATMKVADASPTDFGNWLALPEPDADVVRSCVTRGEYACPVCRNNHASQQLSCRAGQNGFLLGQTVIATLEPCKGQGFFLVLRESC